MVFLKKIISSRNYSETIFTLRLNVSDTFKVSDTYKPQHSKIFRIIFSILMGLFICFKINAQADWVAKFDKLMLEAESKDIFSGNVLVAQDGKIIYQKTIGKADIEKNILNTPDTRYPLASLTKLLTKIIILQLIEEKKVAFGDPLSKYIDGFGAFAQNITVQHLLEHQAGFGQYYDAPGFEDGAMQIQSINDIVTYIRKEEPMFPAGTRTEYSNSGYVLLAAIIEKVLGKTYENVLKDRIFNPLSLSTAGFNFNSKNIPDMAIGYITRELGPKKKNVDNIFPSGGDGGVYMTVADFFKIDKALFDNDNLLPPSVKRYLFHDGTGKYLDEWAPDKLHFAIGGGAPGISTVYGKLGPKKVSIIAFSNYDEGSADELFLGMVNIINNKPQTPLRPPLSKFIYDLIKTKGATYFTKNIHVELKKNGYELNDDMMLLFAGKKLLEEKRGDDAIALYLFYTRSYPKIVVAWNDLGDAYLLKNNKLYAKKCFERALELRPQNERARRSLEKLNN